ncbi:MAG TPA: GAF domain-containing protein [Anaerolineae bacterium]|nr:GAF domain-containing protein [Anaerolineae bacterium]HMR63413.1 GAF domain-containing protein [Anaerolineae bacterium]
MVATPPGKPKKNLTNDRLTSLYELIGLMNSVDDLSELLAFVMDRALSLTGGRQGLLILTDHDHQLRRPAVVRGESFQENYTEAQILDLVSTSVIQDVLDQGQPRLIMNLPGDVRYEQLVSRATIQLKSVRSVLAVPLKIGSDLIGLIYLDHSRQAVFDQSDLDFLSAFASQAALVIYRTQQHQRQIEELTLLNQLSRSVVEVLDLNEVLTRIVGEAARVLQVETGSVLMLSPDGSELYFAISISDGQRIEISTRLRSDQGIAGWVLRRGEPVCLSDVSQDERWFGEVAGGFTTRSLLAVPLQSAKRALGVLQVLNKKSEAGFSRSDMTLLSAFATSATIAIENARLFEEANQARRLRALNDIALSLSKTLDLSKALNTGLRKTMSLLGAEAGVISLVDKHAPTDAAIAQVTDGLALEPGLARQQLRAINQLSGRFMMQQRAEPVIMDALGNGAKPAGSDPVSTSSVPGLPALALVPINTADEISGVLAIMYAQPHPFAPEEVSLLTGAAQIIGLAAQNATHYRQMQDKTMHLTYLNEIGSALTSSLDLTHVLRVNIEGVNSVLRTERTSVFLIDDKTNELVLRFTNEGDADIRLPYPWQGIAGWVATHDEPALVNNVPNDPRHSRLVAEQAAYEARSILCVPLKVNNEVIGVVEALNRIDGRDFEEAHLTLLIEFTRWAAIAIHNARLFDELVDAYEHLEAEQRRRITAETRGTMAAVILDIAHTMNNIVGAIRVWALTLENAAAAQEQSPVFKKFIRQIRQNAEEAIGLIHRLRGPLDPPELVATDVHRCLERAIQSCWRPNNVLLTRAYAPDLPLATANDNLQTVFHNLLSNAVQALTETGGLIEIITRRAPAGCLEIAISDNGPGIPAELKDNIFKPGISSKAGLGFGLWLVETFVHQYEGEIDFASSPGQGTSFTVRLQPWLRPD